jgi:hypothetical protein
MVDVRRAFTRAALAAIAALVTLQSAACGASHERPADAVLAYFHGLASDPASTLLVTSPSFQSKHGIRLTRNPDAPPPADPTSPAEIARAQLAWTLLLSTRRFRDHAASLAVEIVRVEETEDHAVVETRVTPVGASPFTQRFLLARKDGTGRWRIDAIEQEDVKIGSHVAAFTAAPSESLRRTLPPGEFP